MKISFDLNPQKFGSTLLVAALSLTVGWSLGRQQEDRPANVRDQLVGEMHRSQELLDECFLNMKNQFTPGYKALIVFDRLNSGRPHIRLTQGEIFKTQCPTDLAINGQGFFTVQLGGQLYYTRDGRFQLSEGELRSHEGGSLLGFEGDSQGNAVSGNLKPIHLSLDPRSRLYAGKYSGYHFDETGRLYGETTTTNPVTGQVVTGSDPLAQVALTTFAGFKLTHSRLSPTLLVAEDDPPVVGCPAQGSMGVVCPGSLELSNVDFMEEGYVISALKSYAGLLMGNEVSRPLPPAPAMFSSAPAPRLDQQLGALVNGGRPSGFYDSSMPRLRESSVLSQVR